MNKSKLIIISALEQASNLKKRKLAKLNYIQNYPVITELYETVNKIKHIINTTNSEKEIKILQDKRKEIIKIQEKQSALYRTGQISEIENEINVLSDRIVLEKL